MTSTARNGPVGLSSASTATKINAAAMVVAIAGIVIQIAAGVDFPTIPPGPIILGVAVLLVAFTRWPWVPYLGVVVPLFLLVGGAVAAVAKDDNPLREPGDDVAAFTGTAIQMVAVVVALVAGVQALREQRG